MNKIQILLQISLLNMSSIVQLTAMNILTRPEEVIHRKIVMKIKEKHVPHAWTVA